MLAVGIVGGVVGDAQAQTAPSAQPVAASIVGQVSANSALSTAKVDNSPRFSLVPSVRTVYETNTLGYVEVRGPRDNVRVTPGVDLNYHRQFGRVALGVSGSAGYDFNSRFRFLNQRRIDFSGSAQAPVGSVCSFRAQANYDTFRYDLNDTQAQVGSVSTTQFYGVGASCTRGAGFSPVGRFNYRSLSSSRSRFFNYKQYISNLGIAYAQPSIGTVTLTGTVAQLRRPFLAELTGVNDDTDVYSVTLGLNRSVSPRVRISASGGVTKADPKRRSVAGFVGASYNGEIDWSPIPRFTLSGTGIREITNQNGISSTYVVRESYGLSASLKVGGKSSINVSGNRSRSDYRGEDLTPTLVPVRVDRFSSVSSSYSYNLSRRLRASVSLSHRWRNADNPLYDYTSTALSSSIGANF
jgi:hypothetical protein